MGSLTSFLWVPSPTVEEDASCRGRMFRPAAKAANSPAAMKDLFISFVVLGIWEKVVCPLTSCEAQTRFCCASC